MSIIMLSERRMKQERRYKYVVDKGLIDDQRRIVVIDDCFNGIVKYND